MDCSDFEIVDFETAIFRLTKMSLRSNNLVSIAHILSRGNDMKAMILTSAFFALVIAVSCGKKDEGGGPTGPQCGANHVFSPAFNSCVPQGQCPPGLGVNPQQPSMCMEIRTGLNQYQQQCGVGFFMTAQGCYQQGPCPQGQALRGDVCVNVVSGSSGGGFQSYQQQQMPGYQYNMNPWGSTYNPYMGYPQYGGYFRF